MSGRSPRSSAATGSRRPRETPPRSTTSSTKYGDAVLPLQLDVTDRDADFAAVAAGARALRPRWTSWSTTRATASSGSSRSSASRSSATQLETNVFGAMWVTQAALPFLREQRGGHIVQVSSIGGISRVREASAPTTPRSGRSRASRQALAQEVRRLRHPRDADRARRFRDRLGRAVGQACRRRSRRTPMCASRPTSGGRPANSAGPGQPPGLGRGHPPAWWTLTSRHCACFFGLSAAGARRAPTTSSGSRRGRSGSTVAELAQG